MSFATITGLLAGSATFAAGQWLLEPPPPIELLHDEEAIGSVSDRNYDSPQGYGKVMRIAGTSITSTGVGIGVYNLLTVGVLAPGVLPLTIAGIFVMAFGNCNEYGNHEALYRRLRAYDGSGSSE